MVSIEAMQRRDSVAAPERVAEVGRRASRLPSGHAAIRGGNGSIVDLVDAYPYRSLGMDPVNREFRGFRNRLQPGSSRRPPGQSARERVA